MIYEEVRNDKLADCSRNHLTETLEGFSALTMFQIDCIDPMKFVDCSFLQKGYEFDKKLIPSMVSD